MTHNPLDIASRKPVINSPIRIGSKGGREIVPNHNSFSQYTSTIAPESLQSPINGLNGQGLHKLSIGPKKKANQRSRAMQQGTSMQMYDMIKKAQRPLEQRAFAPNAPI